MQAARPTPPAPRRRGPRPRHSREDVIRAAVAIADQDGLDAVTFRAVAARLGTGVMSLYSYVPDKQSLVYDMVEQVGAEIELPPPTGDWRADMHVVARLQRDLAHRHPWLIAAVSHLQPLGPGMLALLEFALGALEPAGLSVRDRLETIAMINGFVLYSVRAELSGAPDPEQQARQFSMLPELLATGRYPRFAAALAQGGEPETFDPAAHFDRLIDKILDGLVRPSLPYPGCPRRRRAQRHGGPIPVRSLMTVILVLSAVEVERIAAAGRRAATPGRGRPSSASRTGSRCRRDR